MKQELLSYIEHLTPEQPPGDLKNTLISGIMELSIDERKELLAMWKGRKNNET